MAAHDHIIHKQIFDLQIPSRDSAFGLQQEVRAVFDDDLLPLINRLFDEISGPGEILRINRLELNLGHIDPLRLREQLVTQLKVVLSEKLQEARAKAKSRPGSLLSGIEEAVIIEHDVYQMDAVLQSSAASIPSLLEAFFINGDLPWWAPDESQQPDISELTTQLLDQAPEQFEQVFMQVLKHPQAAIRMVNQLSATLLKRIAKILWPQSARIAFNHREAEAVMQYLLALGVLNAELVQAPANTPSPVYLMAVAAAARIVSLPTTLTHSAQTETGSLAAWLVVAAATASDTEPEIILRVAEITLLSTEAAQRANQPMPETIAAIIVKRIIDKQHNLPASVYTQLLEVSISTAAKQHSSEQTARLVSKFAAIATETTVLQKRITKLFAGEPFLTQKNFIAALADEKPELALQIVQALEAENSTTTKTLLQEITASLSPSRKKPESEKLEKISSRKTQSADETFAVKKAKKKSEEEITDPEEIQTEETQATLIEELNNTFEQLLEVFTDTETEEEESEGIPYHNKRHRLSRWGGLVILGPYLPALFQETGLLNDKGLFKNKEAAFRGIFLLHYICTGTTKAPEYALTLHKLLCGLPFNKSVPKTIRLTKKEKQEADDLLEAMAEQWTSLRSPVGDAIRQNFMKRTAIIEKKDGAWLVRIQRTSLDILLDSLPWSISVIRLPWTQHLIQTEW